MMRPTSMKVVGSSAQASSAVPDVVKPYSGSSLAAYASLSGRLAHSGTAAAGATVNTNSSIRPYPPPAGSTGAVVAYPPYPPPTGSNPSSSTGAVVAYPPYPPPGTLITATSRNSSTTIPNTSTSTSKPHTDVGLSGQAWYNQTASRAVNQVWQYTVPVLMHLTEIAF